MFLVALICRKSLDIRHNGSQKLSESAFPLSQGWSFEVKAQLYIFFKYVLMTTLKVS